ncbi:DUF1697 domain-containing protein [Nocardiopsis ganjiahuensis]|uniref:DUF1697 domain-containing protein n=1 Tax=Nocardiopsis ganjiahuensis TaxID=239984 RepID=UPI00035CDC93|nr:DUF1697 domain-containing protein [Nocardiopsis ganjiahuensis]
MAGMTRHIVLLRGVNVGGHRKLPMAELRAALSELGHTDVATYIQSGNAVLTSEEGDPEAVGALVRGAVRDRFGFDVPVMVRTLDQLRAVVAANPLPVADPSVFTVLFCSEPVDTAALSAIDPATHPGERIAVTPTEVFTHHERGVRGAKLPAVVGRHCPGEVTARNWRTVLRLLELAEGS